MFEIQRLHRLTVAAAAVLVAAGCAKSDEGTTDTAGGTTAAATPTDTGAAGMDHSTMPGMNRPPAKDGDHEFLRMMSDHHEGLIQMATAAMTKASTPAAQGDAHKLHTKQAEEQKQMLGMVQTSYGETVTPMVMPSNKAMNDSLQSKTGAEYDRTFYANVVAHHREGIKMIDDMMPKLTKPDVKQMAEKMKADQQKEIAEFQRKMQ
jgi:uncharacterized protein (DUF305 family)